MERDEAHAVAGIPQAQADAQGPVERIERLKPSQMRPDRFQPRRLLPAAIRGRFFSGELDCYQAAQEWLALAAGDRGWREQVDELLAMGGSFQDHGQIKPITGQWVEGPAGGFIFEIETGERRYWAACLRAAEAGAEEEPWLRVEVVAEPSRQRQVVENRHAQSPSAVSQACEIAALLLEGMGIRPDPEMEEAFDYFRQALGRRVPRGLWPKIEPVMQLSTRRMQQLLAILQLPTGMLELADRHRMPERILREVLSLPKGEWEQALEVALQKGLTAQEVAELSKGTGKARARRTRDDGRRSPQRIAYTGIRRFARAVLNANREMREQVLDEVADEVVVEGYAEALLPMLRDLSGRIEARLKGRDG
jgi:hypothetical protein